MLSFAQVTAVHPDRRTFDMVDVDNGRPFAEVTGLVPHISTDSGSWNTPASAAPPSDAQAGGINPTGRTVLASYALYRGRPVILGFHMPSGGQVAFTEDNREVHRHPSGAYTTIAPDGSIETYHPSGAYIRIGAGAHQDLSSVSTGAWQEETGAAPPQITVANGSTFTATVMPNGDTTITSSGKLTATYQGDATIETQGNLLMQASGTATISAPSIVLDGALTQGKGGHGGDASIQGPLNVVENVAAGGPDSSSPCSTPVVRCFWRLTSPAVTSPPAQ
jgi:hypothetical protein